MGAAAMGIKYKEQCDSGTGFLVEFPKQRFASVFKIEQQPIGTLSSGPNSIVCVDRRFLRRSANSRIKIFASSYSALPFARRIFARRVVVVVVVRGVV